MTRVFLFLFLIVSASLFGQSVRWMTSLEAAQRLSLIQNKMVLMIWEESHLVPQAATFEDSKGKRIFIQNVYNNSVLMNLLSDYFILVKVSESQYETLLAPVKNLQSTAYINKFNSDSMKIMDANGFILNVNHTDYNVFVNLTEFIEKYAINTGFLKVEMTNYRKRENFVTALRLASKYIDLAMYTVDSVREEVIMLSTIYLNNAKGFLEIDITGNLAFTEKIDLLKIKQDLIMGRPRKALRQLKRIGNSPAFEINEDIMAFLYFTVYSVLNKEEQAAVWENKVSLVNLNKSKQIITNFE